MYEFSRTEMLIGTDALKKLSESTVAVFGIGGVGGYAAEALARAGIGGLTLIDGDCIEPSNLNRQIHATHGTIGLPKAEAMKERILGINPAADVKAVREFYLPGSGDHLISESYDYIIDAVDTVSAKIGLVLAAGRAEIPIISSMGAGNRLDPARFEVADIYETSVCPLARVMRRELRKRGVPALRVVYSKEEPVKPIPEGSRTPGSVSFVPPVAGMILAGEVIKYLMT